jgi:hypothetical protein
MKTLLLPLFTLTFYFLFSQESNNDFFYLKQDLHKKSSINSNKTEALNSRLIGYCGKMFSSGSWRNFDSAVFVYSGTRGGDFNSQKYPKADTQVSYYWNVNEWGESYKWNVTYDPENRKTEQELLEQSINNWVKLEKTTFNYNFNGDISEDINYLFKNNIYKKNYKNIYNYDAKNRLSTIDCNKWDSITWVDFSRVLYDYDSSDNVNKETTQLLNNGNWVNTKIKLNKYNTANNLIYTQQDSIINGIMTPFF